MIFFFSNPHSAVNRLNMLALFQHTDLVMQYVCLCCIASNKKKF